MLKNLDTWIAFFTLAALAFYVLPEKIRAGMVAASRAGVGLMLSMFTHATSKDASTSKQAPAAGRAGRPAADRAGRRRQVRAFKPRSRALNAGEVRSAQQDAEEGSVQRSAFSIQRSTSPAAIERPADREELRLLGEALRLKLTGEARTKQAAIERAFNISKGGGDDWRRASWLYDQAMQRLGPARAREVDAA